MTALSICSACSAENEHFAHECFKCGRSLFALTEGTLLSLRYKILSPLGRGGMGMVYEAYDEALRQRVAIKVLRPDRERPGEMENRFLSECKLARRVRHRNVCRIDEYGQDQGRYFVAMELIEGSDFKEILRNCGALSWQEAFDVATQVADGLQAMHEAGIVHRDLKPSNIMRDPAGVVRLMDFGIAKRFEADADATRHTATGRVVGTPEYMSPEQIYGESVDPRSDVYSLGIVVFELFTGAVPFRGDTPASTMMKQIREAPQLAEGAAGRLPRQLVPVLRTALEKRPDDRYASAIQMRDAIRRAHALKIASAVEGEHPTEQHLAGTDWRPLPPPEFADDSSAMLPAPQLTRAPGTQEGNDTERHRAESKRPGPPLVPEFRGDSSAAWPNPEPTAPSAVTPDTGFTPGGAIGRRHRWLGLGGLTGLGVLWLAGSGLMASRATPGGGDRLSAGQGPPPPPSTATVVAMSGRMAETPAPVAVPSAEPPPSARAAGTDRPQTRRLRASTPVKTATEQGGAFPTPARTDFGPGKPEPSPSTDASMENASPAPPAETRPSDPVAPIEPGMLRLVALPWAEVAVDGIPVGITPFKPMSLAPGIHIVLLSNPGYQPLMKKVTVEPGKTTNLEVDLAREAFPKQRP